MFECEWFGFEWCRRDSAQNRRRAGVPGGGSKRVVVLQRGRDVEDDGGLCWRRERGEGRMISDEEARGGEGGSVPGIVGRGERSSGGWQWRWK